MSVLFEVENGVAKPTAESLLIPEIKAIWDRDNSADKNLAIREISYVEFSVSMLKSNPFRGYPEDIKKEKIKETLFSSEENWSEDRLVSKAIEYLVEFTKNASVSYTYFMATKKALEKMKNFFETVDLSDRTRSGTPVYKPADLTRAINDTSKALESFKTLEKKVQEELFESVKTKGQRDINPFEEA